MTTPALTALGRRARDRLNHLATLSDDGADRLTRLFLSPSHIEAVALVRGWFEEAGLETRVDPLLTVRGELAPSRPGQGRCLKRLLIGSHIDSVVDAGRYDGCLGVVAGLIALEEIRARGLELPFAVELLAFGDEEGVRFPVTLTSASAVAGTLTAGMLDACDHDGISIREALVKAGGDPEAALCCAYDRDDVLGYLEVHIEQGPVLESEGLALGVVTAIAGQSRFRISVTGEAGHAGTVPMYLRRDALAASAEMMRVIEEVALRGSDAAMVATVGQLMVLPGATNVIPAEVHFSLDLRAADDPARLNALHEIRHRCRAIARDRQVGFVMETVVDRATTPTSRPLQAVIADAIEELGLAPRYLPSGAGHDGLAIKDLTEIGMIFVRCRGGISHNPLESAEVNDLGLAIEALIGTLKRLADKEEGGS